MGYSCTQDADHMLGVISHYFATDGNKNILTIGGKQYFFERGREQDDGAITGKLMQMDGEYCFSVGSVRIEPDGESFRFPRISKTDHQEIVSTFQDMQARNPQLLRSWSQGVI